MPSRWSNWPQLKRATHTITLIRMRLNPATKKTYVARRVKQGKSARDAQR